MNLGLSFIYKTENLTAAARESMDLERKKCKDSQIQKKFKYSHIHKESNIHRFTKSQIFTEHKFQDSQIYRFEL